MKVKSVNVVIKDGRSKLSEGRCFGLGFAFCKRTKDGLATVQPPSTCKDYLNDVVAVERFAPKSKVEVFGLAYQAVGDVFDKEHSSYLFFMPLENKGGTIKGYSVDEECKNLDKAIPTILETLHDFETRMGFKTKTEIFPTNHQGGYVALVPEEWTSSTYMISLYSLMIRSLQYVDYSSKLSMLFGSNNLECNMLANVKAKVDYMLKTKKLPSFDINKFMSGTTVSSGVHNAGIMGWLPSNDAKSKFMGAHPTTNLAILTS